MHSGKSGQAKKSALGVGYGGFLALHRSLFVHWYLTGTALVLDWYNSSASTALVLHMLQWCYMDTTLAIYGTCIASMLALHLYCIGATLVAR